METTPWTALPRSLAALHSRGDTSAWLFEDWFDPIEGCASRPSDLLSKVSETVRLATLRGIKAQNFAHVIQTF
jgi:hypothetical protein